MTVPGDNAVPPVRPAPAVPTADALRHSLDELIRESQALRVDVHKAEQLRAVKIAQIRRENLINLVLLGGLTMFMVILLAVAYQNNQIGHDTKRNADLMVDCTAAGGRCYEEGRARTTAAVVTLQRVQVYVVECSRELPAGRYTGHDFDRRLEACVQARVAAAARHDAAPPPVPAPAPAPTPTR